LTIRTVALEGRWK